MLLVQTFQCVAIQMKGTKTLSPIKGTVSNCDPLDELLNVHVTIQMKATKAYVSVVVFPTVESVGNPKCTASQIKATKVALNHTFDSVYEMLNV